MRQRVARYACAVHFGGASHPRKRIAIPRRRYQARYTNVTPAALFLECRKGVGVRARLRAR